MKVTFNIDCTPEEARAFLGLPDVAPLQERMMDELQERMSENIRNLDPETFMKTWLPATIQSWGDIQKLFWNQMATAGNTMSGMGNADSDDKKSGKAK
jgi:hypothetical protein